MPPAQQTDVLIIGAGAAGLMCAIAAGKRGRSVTIIEHTAKIAEKIRISGGGRCNFTNIHTAPSKFISNNPHFATSALKRFTPQDFIAMVDAHNIPWHEKTLGQLFCDRSANDIINMLLDECRAVNVKIHTETTVTKITPHNPEFTVHTSAGDIHAASVVIATGGLSIPKIGASPFGFEIAAEFGLKIIEPRAALVPLTFDTQLLGNTADMAGVAVDPVRVTSAGGQSFDEAMLFTHRGISGPAILQISSYWEAGEDITINLSPTTSVLEFLKTQRKEQPRKELRTIIGELLPKRLAEQVMDDFGTNGRIADMNDKTLSALADRTERWRVHPNGHEGYRTAEVTRGGVDTDEISSKTFEAKKVPGLYFIGEVLDVTGHLGGYNFQWAWASGHAAGQFV